MTQKSHCPELRGIIPPLHEYQVDTALMPGEAAHQCCHIERNAASTLHAKAPSSHIGDVAMRGRKARRRSSKRPELPASATAISTYSSIEFAIKSVRPIWVSRLAPTRPAWR